MSGQRASTIDAIRRLLLTFLSVAIFVQIVFLWPDEVEKIVDESDQEAIAPTELLQEIHDRDFLAPGIPRDRVPEYTIRQFEYVSTQGNLPQWKLVAQIAHLYNQEQLVHSQKINATLYHAEGGTVEETLITGKEARYFMNQRDLEVYGDVVATFPDGFKVYSDYMKYKPESGNILVPATHAERGSDSTKVDKRIDFDSYGLKFDMNTGIITLPSDVRFRMTQLKRDEFSRGVPYETSIYSDWCTIDRNVSRAKFRMSTKRPMTERFVRVYQPDLRIKGRKVDLNYEEYLTSVKYIRAIDDVEIVEIDPSREGKQAEKRYATCGQADLDSRQNVIWLTKFPQVYDAQDTVTGDVIKLYRDRDVVDVVHSNAYSEGDR